MLHIFQNYNCVEPCKLFIVGPTVVLLIDLGVVVEIVKYAALLHQQPVQLKQIFYVGVQIVVFDELGQQLLDSRVAFNKKHLFLWERNDNWNLRAVICAEYLKERGSVGFGPVEI